MKKVKSIKAIKDPYSKRILSNIINKDPLKICAQTPGELQRLTRGLTEKQLSTSPKQGKWSITHLVSHFCDAEWAMGFRIRMAIAQPGRHFQAYDQDKWADHLYYNRAKCREKLNLFTTLRKAHLSLLKSLKPNEWQRYGIHEERGKETVERMIHMLAGHDVNHLRQVDALRRSLLKKRNH
ncbi:MAG: DinB family protein [Candidatus Rokubacteria bacterium]|nr:DinB family protein [Ignavibacteria bacterium]MBI3624665.1 DinB family protein [Candidatus Rokubacteria bacterium]